MKLAVLFSGGKDSCLALHKVLQEQNLLSKSNRPTHLTQTSSDLNSHPPKIAKANFAKHEVIYLLNIFPKNEDSFMFHKPNLNLLARQADELGIELIVRESEGEKEEELGDLKDLIGRISDKVEGLVVGGIASSYQGNRIKKICNDLNLKFIAPLWGYSPEEVWGELLAEKFQVVLTKIACDGLDERWIGRVIDSDAFEELKKVAEKKKFRIDFEGGEAESAVLFMPGFERKIEIDFEVVSEGDYRYFMKIKEVR